MPVCKMILIAHGESVHCLWQIVTAAAVILDTQWLGACCHQCSRTHLWPASDGWLYMHGWVWERSGCKWYSCFSHFIIFFCII